MADASAPTDLMSLAELLSISGLEAMVGIRDGTYAPPPIAGLLDYTLDSVDDGRVVFRGTPGPRVLNPMGTVHGGYYGTLLDSAMGCAVMTKVPIGQLYTTLEYKVNITRALPVGTEVLCEGVIQHAGRSTAIANGELRGAADGKLYATASTTCMIFTPKGA